MRRLLTCCVVLSTLGLLLSARLPLAPAQDKKDPEQQVKTLFLKTLYTAYQAYETKKGKPAKSVDDLRLPAKDLKQFKKWFNFDELGLSLVDAKKDNLAKLAMVYELEAATNGGLVLFYDGSVRSLSAAEVKKLLGREK